MPSAPGPRLLGLCLQSLTWGRGPGVRVRGGIEAGGGSLARPHCRAEAAFSLLESFSPAAARYRLPHLTQPLTLKY